MTDVEIAALAITSSAAGGGGFVAFLKWCVGQWREERKLEREAADRKLEREAADRREDRAAVSAIAAGVDDVQLTLAAILERDRVRHERRKRESDGIPILLEERETTDVVSIKSAMKEQRRAVIEGRRTTPLAVPRPGTHGHER